ncbi:MAG: M20 family peptidase [Chloroflexi bacterium]|nr:MAG: M20 family peptidase [Chloroflexota bacterium]
MIGKSQLQAIRAYLDEKLESHYLPLLREMVHINSFTANAAGVNQLGQLTAELFAPLGFTAEFVPPANPQFGNHLVLTRPGKSGRRMGFVSHLDTVFPPEEEIRNNFRWRRQGHKIYGPGTVDIKGGTLIMYMMLDALHHFQPALYDDVTWVLLLNSAEETGSDDFGHLVRQRLAGADTVACLVFEAGSMVKRTFQVVVARKGMGVFEVQVEGKASHAGSAHQNGANAIVQLAEVIRHLANLTDYTRDVTVNVGVVSGGTVTNRVPHYAEAALEMRAFDPTVFAETVAEILAHNGRSTIQNGNGDFACQVRVEMIRRTEPWPRNPKTDRLLGIWQTAAQALGYKVLPEERGGLSDGNHFWDVIPTLDGLGPSGGNAHCSEQSADGSKEQEYCLVTSFVPKTMLNLTAVSLLLTQSS